MTVAALVSALLHLTGNPPGRSFHARLERVAPVLLEVAAAARMDPLLVGAVIWRESAFDQGAVGRHGELGVMQLLPRGWARAVCTDLLNRLLDLRANVECGVRILEWARQKCGGGPERWLSLYNGSGCGPTRYARRVLAVLKWRH